jgi:flavoprotein
MGIVMKKRECEFETIIDGKKTKMSIDAGEVENLKKIKQIDDKLVELKKISDRMNIKIDKWNTQK